MSVNSHVVGVTGMRWLVAGFMLSCTAAPTYAADKLWNEPVSGVFTLASNWFGGVPGPNDVARFETTNSNSLQRTYSVSFANSPVNQQLVVEDDNVTFVLLGNTYMASN